MRQREGVDDLRDHAFRVTRLLRSAEQRDNGGPCMRMRRRYQNMLRINGISTAIVADTGGGLGTFENAFAWMGNGANTPDGQYIRRGSLFGGTAIEGLAVLRYARVYNEPSDAVSFIASGFHVQRTA